MQVKFKIKQEIFVKHLCPPPQQFGISMTFDLDLWPTDLKINRDHQLIKDNLPTKFEVCEVKHSRVIDCTRWGRPTYRPTNRPTDRLTDGQTDRQTEGQIGKQTDRGRTKWSICVALLRRQHKKVIQNNS